MSGLAAILADRHPAGVFTWHSGLDPVDVGHAVEHAGWRFGYVDGWVAQSKPEFLGAVGRSLAFPDHYGRNLDALVDCLRELDGRTVLLWDGWAPLARDDPRAFGLALDVFAVRAARTPAFVVLLRGPGPDLPTVPTLD